MIIMLYNPAQMEKEELYDTFVARERLLGELLETMSDNAGKKSIQHIILLGARGIGKTNMLRMVENKVLDSPQLRNKWIAVNIPEEQYGIFGIVDFFKYILEIILHSTQLENVDKKVYQKELEDIELSRQKESIDKLVSILKDISRGENKQFLLLVDNIDKILAEKITEEKELEYLRSILMTENFIMILGTSTSIFEEIALYDKAFFRFFKTIHLQNLNDKQVEELLLKRAKFDGIIDKIKLDENKNKIKAITDLTGGYPRLVLMLYEILEDKPLLDVLKTFNKLLDNLTPYYKHRMDDLTPQQQKIIDTIMLSDGVASPTDVANKVGWKPTVVTSQFTRLKDVSILQVKEDGEKKKKKSIYEISDKLFVIWYQMRYLGVLRRRIEYIVTFLKIWYDLEGLKDKISSYASHYQQFYLMGNYSDSYAYARSISILSNAIADTDETEKVFHEQFSRYILIYKFDDALKEQEELLKIHEKKGERKKIALDYFVFGSIFKIQGELQKALEHYKTALKINEEIDNTEGITDDYSEIGEVYLDIGDLSKALEYFEKALKINEKISNKENISSNYRKISKLYHKQRDMQKTMEYFEKALKIDEEIVNKEGIASNYGGIGDVYFEQGNLSKALEYFQKAVKIYEEIDNKRGINLNYQKISIVYVKEGDLSKAIEIFGNVLKIPEDKEDPLIIAMTYVFMSNLYQLKGDILKAQEFSEKALKIKIPEWYPPEQSNLVVTNKINVLLTLAIVSNKERNIGSAIEYIKDISKLLSNIKNTNYIQTILLNMIFTLLNLLADDEYNFVITILDIFQKEHEDIFEVYEPFRISAQFLKTKDHSILENTSSIVLEGVNKILDAVEKQKLN